MGEIEPNITEFRISLRDRARFSQVQFQGVQELLKDRIHQAADLSNIFYAPSDVYAELKASWSFIQGTLTAVRKIAADSVSVLHCSSYVNRFDYVKEEPNIKAIILSKGYDIGVCTGRTLVKYYCSDLIYLDRFFDYRFGDRRYWFICYLSTLDNSELISDKFKELFGARRGQEVFAWLQETLRCKEI